MKTSAHRTTARLRASRGQSIVEMAIVMPLLLLITLGVVETSYALLDQHVVTKLAREGSNLISRDTSLQQAANVLTNMQTQPVNFNNGTSTVIFSVLQKGAATGTSNFGQVILFQRAKFGSLPATSRLSTAGGSYGGPPEYLAVNPTTNTGLQVTNLPDSIINVNGGFLYVTEIFTRHTLITGLDGFLPPLFRVALPSTLYSIAYF
jgi:Flp pilus assembly protein TadG